MGIFTFTQRINDLIYQKHDVDYQKLLVQTQIKHLKAYSTMVDSKGVSIGKLLSLPASMVGRAINYLNTSNAAAMQYVQQNSPYMEQMWQQQYGAPQSAEQAQMIKEYIGRMLYQQSRDESVLAETRSLKEAEQQMQLELDRLDANSQEIKQELDEAKKARDAAVKDMAPKYTAN